MGAGPWRKGVASASRSYGGDVTKSGQDWAWTREQLKKGRKPAEVETELAGRRPDKPNPDYYARITVRNAERSLAPGQSPSR